MARDTQSRRTVLRDLLADGRACTQTELCELLSARGFPVTQSTVSRDLKRIGAQRSAGDEGLGVYRLAPRRGLSPGMVIAVAHNEQLVVIRTVIGRAQAVGLDIDALENPEVLGTLAGDDTVLVVPRSVRHTEALAEHFRGLAGLGSREL